MSRRRNVWLGLLSAAAALLVVYGVYVVQINQIKLQKSVKVLAPAAFIPAGTLITDSMLAWKTVTESAATSEMATSMRDVVQMETMVPLGEGEPILLWKLDKFRLLPRDGEATFQLPKEYVLSIASGIRAGDVADLYVSGPDGRSERLFGRGVTIASVKSAAGLEVDDKAGSNLLAGARGDRERMYASRREDSGVIDRVNLNLTQAEWLEIDRMCKVGVNRLVIALTANSIQGGQS